MPFITPSSPLPSPPLPSIAGGSDFTVRLWDLYSGALVHTFAVHGGGVKSIVSCPPDINVSVGELRGRGRGGEVRGRGGEARGRGRGLRGEGGLCM